MGAAQSRVLAFGEYELDFARGELRRAGAPVELQATPLRLLLYLAERRDRTVRKEELLSAIWHDAIVGDASLAKALANVREAVGDDGDAQRVIRTQKGLGYRFVAEVEEQQAAAEAPRPSARHSRRGWMVLAAAAIAAAAMVALRSTPPESSSGFPPTVALAPFVNLSGDVETQRVADSLTEEVIQSIDSIHTPETRAFSVVSGTNNRSRAAAGRIEGSVRRDGREARVVVRLVSAETGGDLWSEVFQVTLDNPLHDTDVAAQRIAFRQAVWSLGEAIANAAKTTEEKRFVREAVPLLVGGPFADVVQKADRLLSARPDSWIGHTFAAWAWAWLYTSEQATAGEAFPQIAAHAARAREIRGAQADIVAYVSAYEQLFAQHWEAVEPLARSAATSDLAVFSEPLLRLLMSTGRTREAVATMRLAVARNPGSPWFNALLSNALFANGELDAASTSCARANELFGNALDFCGAILWQLGRREEAARGQERAYAVQRLDSIAEELARLHASAGPEAVWRRLATGGAAPDPINGAHIWRAFFHAQLNDEEGALSELEASASAREPWLSEYSVYPIFDPIRDTPRFRALIEEMGLTAYHAQYLKRARMASTGASPAITASPEPAP